MPFDREVSIIAVRGTAGRTASIHSIQNAHREGILRLTTRPRSMTVRSPVRPTRRAALLEHFDYVGVLTIELFQTRDKLIANEMAPRVHNSGHWTIEGAETSQFENHLRGILDLPLGSTAPMGGAAMLNLIGDLPDMAPVLACRDAHLHLYGKHARAGRKLGHITVRRPTSAEAALEARSLATQLGFPDVSTGNFDDANGGNHRAPAGGDQVPLSCFLARANICPHGDRGSAQSRAGPGGAEPSLVARPDGRVYLSWLEPADSGHALRFAELQNKSWSPVRTIRTGRDFFVNWADFPSLEVLPGNRLAAHWLQRTGRSTYAYGVRLALSADGGNTWSAPLTPHRDSTQTEHGFVALWPEGDQFAQSGWTAAMSRRRSTAAPTE